MTDIWTYGYPLRTEVDWADDLLFNYAASRVDDDWTKIRTHHGGNRRSNPQRPTIDHGGGSLTLYGADFIPGESSVLTEAQLRGRHRFRMMLDVGDPITLFEGYLQDGRYTSRRTMRFVLEGLLEQAGRVQTTVSQTTPGVSSTDDSVLALLRDAYDLSELPTVQMPATPLGLYSLDAPAARYASQFAQVSGAFPLVDGTGGLRLHSPTDPPSQVQVFSSSEYAIVGATSEFDIQQLWNRAEINFIADGDIRNFSRIIWDTNAQRHNPAASPPIQGGLQDRVFSASLTLPQLPENTFYRNFELTGVSSVYSPTVNTSITTIIDRDRYPLGSAAIYTSTRFRYNGMSITSQSLSTSGPAGGPITVTVTGVVSGTPRAEWTYRRRTVNNDNDPPTETSSELTRTTTSLGSSTAQPPSVRQWADANVGVRYETFVDGVVHNVEVVSDISILDYDPRTLTFPVWFDSSAESAVQARINDLAKPRSYHNVDFALIQDTDQRTRNVALLNAGDYIELDVHDPRTLTDILATVMIVNVGYDIRSGDVPVKNLVCIETGERPQPAPIYLVSGASRRRIALEGRKLSLVRR